MKLKYIGFEPTFAWKPFWLDLKDFERFQKIFVILEKVTKNDFTKNIYLDQGVVEIPSDPMKLESVDEYVKKLFNLSQHKQLVPSSVHDKYWDGGCHISVSYTKKIDHCIMGIAIKAFLFNHPYVAWAFLNPIDNISSRTINIFKPHDVIVKRIKLYNKTRAVFSLEKRIELRFFEMPKSEEEFMFNVDFTLRLLEYIKNDIKTYDPPKLVKYKGDISDSFVFLTRLCLEIGIKISDMERFNKFNNLRERYSLGSKYLN